jgi:hypothetical protein
MVWGVVVVYSSCSSSVSLSLSRSYRIVSHLSTSESHQHGVGRASSWRFLISFLSFFSSWRPCIALHCIGYIHIALCTFDSLRILYIYIYIVGMCVYGGRVTVERSNGVQWNGMEWNGVDFEYGHKMLNFYSSPLVLLIQTCMKHPSPFSAKTKK